MTANGKSSSVTVPCGKSASVSNAAWTSGSNATIHQTAIPSGALRAADKVVTLKATALTVAMRDFRPASTTTATLAQTGGGRPAPSVPWPAITLGLLLIAGGLRLLTRRAD